MFTLRQKVVMWALYSRIIVICLQVSTLHFFLQTKRKIKKSTTSSCGFSKLLNFTKIWSFQFFVKVALVQTSGDIIEENDENRPLNKTQFQWVRLDSIQDSSEHIHHPNHQDLTPNDIIFMLIGGLISKNELEVQHNLHIANHGYTYEDNLLYFPLYPLMIKGLAEGCNWFAKDLFYLESLSLTTNPAVISLGSVVLNFLFFTLAADRLYLLSRKVLK